ncbi:hypothetical protein, partial [Nocardia sp. NPDC004722]
TTGSPSAGLPPLAPGLAPGALPLAPDTPSFTNLFNRTGLDGELAQPVMGLAAAPSAALVTDGVHAGADPAPGDVVDAFAHTLEAQLPVIES